MEFLSEASNKRFVALIAGIIFPLVQQKLGLNVDAQTQGEIIALIAAYIVGSHTKEAVVARAEARGKAAAETVTEQNAAEIIKEAAK